MKISEHANFLLNEYGRLQFDYAAYCKPDGESLRNEARNNLEEYIAELEEENDSLQSAWFVEETICPDGSLKPKASALLSRIAELEAAQRWIPVSEPPKVSGKYLLLNIYDDVYPCDFIAGTEIWVLPDYDTITHWMPLPTPPEGKE